MGGIFWCEMFDGASEPNRRVEAGTIIWIEFADYTLFFSTIAYVTAMNK